MHNRTGNTFQRPLPVSEVDRFPPATPTPRFYECAICGAMHFETFDGDCRQDDARFFVEQLDAHYDRDGWQEIDMPGGEATTGA